MGLKHWRAGFTDLLRRRDEDILVHLLLCTHIHQPATATLCLKPPWPLTGADRKCSLQRRSPMLRNANVWFHQGNESFSQNASLARKQTRSKFTWSLPALKPWLDLSRLTTRNQASLVRLLRKKKKKKNAAHVFSFDPSSLFPGFVFQSEALVWFWKEHFGAQHSSFGATCAHVGPDSKRQDELN